MSGTRRVIAGRYRLGEPLASGGMGVVWKGWDQRLERVVAVKQIRLQPGLSATETNAARERAMREARITARLHHPGVVPIYDVVEDDGQPCLIMQFLPSVSLQETLQRHRSLPVVAVARIGSELAGALTAAHLVGIVHRDVKPGNVLLAEDGSARLTDFGISHAVGDVSLTSTGMVTGTPAFLAPEVARGESATYASDVYSLGSTLYTATEGHPPVETDDNPMAVLHRVASERLTPPRRSGLLTPLLRRMLDPDPRLRPGMEEAWSFLASLYQDLTAASSTVDGPELATVVLAPQYAAPQYRSAEAPAGSQTLLATTHAKRSGSRSRRAFLLTGVLGATALVAVGLVYFLLGSGGGSGTTGAATHTSSTQTNAGTNPARTRSASATTSARVASIAAQSVPPSSRTQSTSPNPAGSTGAQLVQAIKDYYALMPRNLTAGWSRLTPAYKSGHAGGFSGYQQFWALVKSVSTSNVVSQPPDSVLATITYHYKDGRTVVERTRYSLIQNGGQWLILTSSTVTSRTT